MCKESFGTYFWITQSARHLNCSATGKEGVGKTGQRKGNVKGKRQGKGKGKGKGKEAPWRKKACATPPLEFFYKL